MSVATRRLSIARHGHADPFGRLTPDGERQARLLGRRLANVPVDVVWHSPLPRAVATARLVAEAVVGTPVIEAPELVDHVPYVPAPEEMQPAWAGFFDGYDTAEAVAGHAAARALVDRFGGILLPGDGRTPTDTHEVVITHAYPIAWLVRQAMDSPPTRWIGLDSANAALTVIEHRADVPPTVVMLNEMSHLPPELRWTGVNAPQRP